MLSYIDSVFVSIVPELLGGDLFSFVCLSAVILDELEVVDCTLKLTFHSFSELFSVTELTFWLRKETNCLFEL